MTVAVAFPGASFDLLNLRPADIDWAFIATRLARIPRFLGGTIQPYSVAQHSVHVMDRTPSPYQAHALLHDAHEAFIGDITRPVARLFDALLGHDELGSPRFSTTLRVARDQIDEVIFKAAGLPPLAHFHGRVVIEAQDDLMLAREIESLTDNDPRQFGLPLVRPQLQFEIWPEVRARREWLNALAHLTGIRVED